MSGFVMTIDDSPGTKRGVCDICGNPAYAPQAKKCAEHRGQRTSARANAMSDIDRAVAAATGTEPPRTDYRGEPPPPSGAPPATGGGGGTDDAKAARAKQIARQIETELNPALAQGMAFVCQPVPATNFYRVEGDNIVPQHLGEAVTLSGLETWVLSHAAAELEGHPMVKSAGTMAAPILPFALGIGAAVLIGAKVYSVYTLREQTMKKWALETAATAPGAEQHAAAAEAAREAEAQRAAQGSMRAEEQAQAAQAAAAEQARVAGANGNATRAEPLTDIDLGQPAEPAVDANSIPQVGEEGLADITDLFASTGA